MIRPQYRPVAVPLAETADITTPGRRAGGVLVVPKDDYQLVGASIAPLLAAINRRAMKLGQGNPRQAATDLDLPAALLPYLPDEWSPWSADLARVDFVLSNGQIRVLESNSGTAVGGSIDVEAFASASSASDRPIRSCAPNSNRIRWASEVARSMGSDVIHLPLWPWMHVQSVDRYFARSSDLAASLGVELRLQTFEEFEAEVRTTSTELVALKLFATLDAIRNGIDLEALGYTAQRADVIWLQGEETAVLSSKGLLASECLAPEREPQLAEILPQTWQVGGDRGGDSAPTSQHGKDGLVFKPLSEHGGAGVKFGAQTSDAAWKELTGGGCPGVVQRVVTVDRVPMEVLSGNGSQPLDFTGPCSFGAYFVKDSLVGVLARVDGQAGHRAVINGHTGAVLTALLPEDAVECQ